MARLLLDTPALLWFAAGDRALSRRARAAIEDSDNDVLVSAASAWEIATKHRLGKLGGAGPLAADFERTVAALSFTPLDIAARHAAAAGAFTAAHRDPFDRVLAAQALIEGLAIISSDAALDLFGVARVW